MVSVSIWRIPNSQKSEQQRLSYLPWGRCAWCGHSVVPEKCNESRDNFLRLRKRLFGEKLADNQLGRFFWGNSIVTDSKLPHSLLALRGDKEKANHQKLNLLKKGKAAYPPASFHCTVSQQTHTSTRRGGRGGAPPFTKSRGHERFSSAYSGNGWLSRIFSEGH